MQLKSVPNALLIVMQTSISETTITIDAAGICHLHVGGKDHDMTIEAFETWCEVALVGNKNYDNEGN